MNSRRNFIKKSSLITLGTLNYNFSSVIKNINGVDISVITYSFNPVSLSMTFPVKLPKF